MFEILAAIEHFLFFVLHVNQSGKFPKALSQKDEQECFMKMAKGDQDARSKLIEHNLRLVVHIAKKYFSPDIEQDDLISIGTIGLIKGVESFNAEKGTRFATYASRCIENEILMFFRNRKKSANDVSVNEPIETDREGNTLTLIDVIACDDNIADNVDLAVNIEQLNRFMKTLDKREHDILCLRYGLGGQDPLPQREVAKRLKISRSYVSRIEKKALTELKSQFDAEDSFYQ
ncbi:MAG: RNA polymerase sporulation sigma factor SigK [Clostridia bacterium]|nr:RNA polymerase sporulation sigma factor SigK [Clostridia bacterium]